MGDFMPGWELVKVELFLRGDANGDRIIDLADVLCVINVLFLAGCWSS